VDGAGAGEGLGGGSAPLVRPSSPLLAASLLEADELIMLGRRARRRSRQEDIPLGSAGGVGEGPWSRECGASRTARLPESGEARAAEEQRGRVSRWRESLFVFS
jgi:hypothetical protein